MIKTSLREDKRAIVGIGTLIVFISMILVAAVAAGVLIRTSGVLQERSYAVAGEARKRLVTGLEVFQVFGTTTRSDGVGYVSELEVFVRTRPGSPSIQMRNVGFTFSTQEVAFSAALQHKDTEEFDEMITEVITNSTPIDLSMDFNRDQLIDRVMVAKDSDGISVLQFDISGVSDYVNVSLGYDLSNTSADKNISLSEVPITYDDLVYGFVDMEINVLAANTSETLDFTQENSTLRIRQFTQLNVCNSDLLLPERFYCFEPRLGNTDTVLDPGELFVLRYKLRPSNALEEEEPFQLSFLPKDGAVTDLEARTPSVLNDKKIRLWPS